MKNKMNKRAQTFTIMALSILVLIIVTAGILTISSDRKSTEKRISTLDNFLFSTEENFERQLFIAIFRTTFLANQEMTNSSQFITDIQAFYNESFYNGTINDVPQAIMDGATYTAIVDSINTNAQKISANVTIRDPLLNISQEDPWNIRARLNFTLILNDDAGLAKWEKEEIIITYVPIMGFEDPLYVVNTNGQISHTINSTPYEGNFVSGSDTSNLLDHVQEGYYINSTDAPSYLKRMQGDTSADPNGVESLVDLGFLSQQGISTSSKSVVDHIYFSADNPSSRTISGMPSWFRIDTNHEELYQVDGL